jgi:mRNA-degrading endonuclease RelE of RelBE toxin-antitoxin system
MAGTEKSVRVWDVRISQLALKQKKRLPEKIKMVFLRLIGDLETKGPIQKTWAHFSSLGKDKRIPPNSYHCHIKSGHPTYVVCWQVVDKKIQIMEIFYVGTHENAPY